MVVAAAVAVLLQAALGVAVELSLFLRDPGYADKEVRLARRETAGTPTVVMLGTSRTGFAFHALRAEEALAADLGRPVTAFNFGIPASGPVTHAVYLRRLLDAGHKPSLLVLEVLPPSLASAPPGPLERQFLTGDRLRREEVETAIGYDFDPAGMRKQWTKSVLLPWHALRYPLLGRVVPSWLPWDRRFDWSRTVDAGGWTTPLVDKVTYDQRNWGERRSREEYAMTLANLKPGGGAGRALADLLALCRDRGVPVVLVLMPESAQFRTMYYPEVTARLDEFLNGVCREYGCRLVNARGWLADDAFTDGHHMLRPGAERFTDRLCREAVGPGLRPK